MSNPWWCDEYTEMVRHELDSCMQPEGSVVGSEDWDDPGVLEQQWAVRVGLG